MKLKTSACERRRFERAGQQLVVHDDHPVGRPTVRVGGTVGENLVADQALTDAPVAVQQVPEVLDVGADLERVAPAADVREQVLRDAEVGAVHDRQQHGAALRVFAAMLAQIAILLDVRLERRAPARRA